MQLTTIASFFALALGITAMPQGPGGPSVNQATEHHPGGEKACCLAHSDIHADGILAGAFIQRILTPLIGSKEQSCAKFQLIENLNLLGMIRLLYLSWWNWTF